MITFTVDVCVCVCHGVSRVSACADFFARALLLQEMFAVEPLCNAPLARDRNERSRRRERRRSYAFPRR